MAITEIASIDINANPVTAWELGYHLSVYPEGGAHGRRFTDYYRELSADEGFGQARFKIVGTRIFLESFFEHCLGRDVKISNSAGEVDYHGFIQSVKMNTGVHFVKKTMKFVANSVWVRYDATGGASPIQRSTVWNDLRSQAKFGIIERTFSGGQQASLWEADQLAQGKLRWLAWPKIKCDFWAGKSGDLYIEITCAGYGETLRQRVYNQNVNSDDIPISDLVADIFAAGVTPYISSTRIVENTILVPELYNTDRAVFDVLESLAAMGDPTWNRWLSRVLFDFEYYFGPAERVD